MRHPISVFLLATAAALTSCDKVRSVVGLPDRGKPEVPTGDPTGGDGGPTAYIRISSCTPCHGTPGLELANADPLVSVAPPQALLGGDPGAHRAHLVDGPFRRAVECASCHLVPTAPPPHLAQQQGKISFSRLATKSWSGTPLKPVWDGATCSGTYCHGAFKNGANATPSWLGAGGVVCGSCHAVSATSGPGGSHPTFSTSQHCGSCHGGAYTNTTVDPSLHMNGVLDAPSLNCSGCHGDPARVAVASATTLDPLGGNIVKAAPPADAGGGTAAVGAHLAHVNQGDTAAPGPLSNAITCSNCHTVPTSIGHSNGSVGVTFGGLATTGGAVPTAYNFTSHTCASTYCHGNFPGGAGANAIAWTGTTKLGCASCHGAPPGPTSATVHHPPNPGCGSCHSGYTSTSVVAATHVNGTIEHTPATGCTQCHGDLGLSAVANTDVRAAPGSDANAVDAHGDLATATTLRGVGAHGAHLTGTTWRSTPIACNECHTVPGAGDTSHADGNPVVAFGTLARTAWGGQPAITPAWNGKNGGTTLTCSSTYCHGAFKNGANSTPTWTSPGSVVCGSCHAVSATNGPGGSHPTFSTTQNCGSCHGGAYTNTTVDPAMHMNGVLEAPNLTCSACHGTSTRAPVASATTLDALGANIVLASPPADVGGGAAAVGAHLAHVNQGDAAAPGPLSDAITCSNCHTVPTSTAHSNGTVNVTFGGLATTGGAVPAAYNFTSHTCASTYCHGNFTGGAGANAIAWTGTTKLGCASCHGAPPGPTSATLHHPPNPNCGSCHIGYTASTVMAATHADGAVDHTPVTGCTQCHGDLTAVGVASTDVRAGPGSNANAVDAHGDLATATTARGMGAHGRHLTGTAWRSTPIPCTECHTVPGAGDVTHANGNPVVSFGPFARIAWPGQPAITPAWNGAGGGATVTCSSTYCHGAFKNGANSTPTWTAPGSVVCGSCHGVSATSGPGGSHPTFSTSQNCGSCHGGAYTNSTVDPTMHMNGVLDVPNLTCSACHGDPARVAVASATTLDALGANIVKASPPADVGGGAAAIGAHLAHVNQGDTAAPGPLSNALTCSSCHTVPTSTAHSTGTVNVTFGGLATTGGAVPAAYNFTSHTCASTYCHGNFAGGAGANSIAWTGATKLGCTACHGAPPGPTSAAVHHPPNPGCGSCHSGYTSTSVAAATHVNGAIEHTPATGCTQCHGDLGLSAVANTDVHAAPGSDANAVDAHGDLATATTLRGVGAHGAHLTGTTWRSTPIACNECHVVPPNGDTAHANGNPVITFGALATTAWAGQPAITPVWNGAGGGATVTCSGTYCHGNFKNAVASAANPSPTWTAPGSVVCGSCHGVSATNGPGGTHPTLSPGQNCGTCHGGSYTNTSVDPSKHMNGVVDGGGESGGGSSCSGCHDAIFSAMNGGVSHLTKHALGNVAGTNDAATDSGITWANPLSTNAPAARSCVNMCHGDHPHDLTSPATSTHENNAYADSTTSATRADGAASRIGAGGTGGAVNRLKTDYDAAQANGGMCASCHQSPVDAARPAVGKAAFDASAHDYASNTVGATTYAWSYVLHDGGLFARDCTKCHASRAEGTTPQVSATGSATVAVHFSDDESLLAGAKNPGGSAAGFVCYNCHGSAATPADGAQGNRSGKDIQSEIAHATTAGQSGHPADSDTIHDSVAEQGGAAFGNALGVAAGPGQRHASCLDCHDPHQAKAGTHAQGTNVAGPPLQGAWGVKWTGTLAAWGTPTSANFTKTAITAGTDLEATLCFKCHSSYYGTLPTSPSSSPAFAETDQAREFNPANPSFHPVLASAASLQGATNNILAPWTKSSLMTCTDCHESSVTTDPNGPHGSAVKFILKGPNTNWSSTVTNTSSGMPAGTFCANCHAANFQNSRFPGHTNGHHNVACFACHVAIPHASGHIGMLVSLPGGAGGNAVTDAAPYAQGTVRLGIGSYPAATASWSNSNCGCGSVATGH